MKLFIVVRRDLPPGAQIAQSVHAAQQFAVDHPETFRDWFETSNTVACLAAADVEHLERVATDATMRGACVSAFREPDLGGALTALAISNSGKTAVRGLPLALQ